MCRSRSRKDISSHFTTITPIELNALSCDTSTGVIQQDSVNTFKVRNWMNMHTALLTLTATLGAYQIYDYAIYMQGKS